jgi:hypothetical protein
MTDTQKHVAPEAVWTLDELLAHVAGCPEAADVRRAVVREGRLAADEGHREELLARRAPRPPLRAEDVAAMDEEAFNELRRGRRRGGFRW